jgi:hypothetical protein
MKIKLLSSALDKRKVIAGQDDRIFKIREKQQLDRITGSSR